MDDEKRPAGSDAAPRRSRRDRDERRQRSAYLYLAALVAVAFLLLLFAYLMQQRNSREILGNLDDLRASMGTIQSIDEVIEENRSLRRENEALKEQLGEAREELVDARGSLSQELRRAEQAEEQAAALLLLEELEYLCRTRQYEAARSLIGPDGRTEEVLAEMDGQNADSYPPERPTLIRRWQAVLDSLDGSAGESGT